MYKKILKNDIKRNKSIIVAVSIFIVISSFLVASSANLMVSLLSSMDQLFESAKQPDFVQYHSGEIDSDLMSEIETWSSKHPFVASYQISEMLNVPGSSVYFNSDEVNQNGSVMESMFTTQNSKFDFLLDLNNNILTLASGEIGVPLFYLQKENLKIGDTITIKQNENVKKFTIKSFVRDAQMNPSIISSKRFLVSKADYLELFEMFSDVEYQIGYQLLQDDQLKVLMRDYSKSHLPKSGPVIDVNLLKLTNAMTDGLVIILVLLISIFLNIIAVLSLRYIIISTLEEDYKEIGIMKALGFKQKQIKKIYMTKYAFITLVSCFIGYLLSILFSHLFMSNILLYIGEPDFNLLNVLIPIASVLLVFMMIFMFCSFTLKRLKKISVVNAISSSNVGESYLGKKSLSIHRWRLLDVNILLGVRDVVLRSKVYGLLLVVFILATFIMIVPVNFHNTVKSDSFIAYTGIGKSHILFDIRQTENMDEHHEDALMVIKEDEDVIKYSSITTSQYEMETPSGETETIRVDSGNFEIFPLPYTNGQSPILENEISISSLYASELEKGVGDTLVLIHDGNRVEMIVTGIYQDITNGGKTTKSGIKANEKRIVSYMINVDVKTNIDEKIKVYSELLTSTKIANVSGYFEETFGNTISQLKKVALVSVGIAITVSVMITYLFVRMLLAKDFRQIVIMKSLGFKDRQIKLQYITRAIIVNIFGILIGSILANNLGESMIALIMSGFGVSSLTFDINPLISIVILPITLIGAVLIATILSSLTIRDASVTDLYAD